VALSGTYYTNVGSGWRLQLEWTATQDISANTSTITAKLYWMSLGSSYTVSSSATKDGSITVDGTSSTFSGAGLAALSGNQKKLLHTYTKTVTHNSDGTKSVSFSAYFDAEVTLSGTYYGRISVSGSATLDTIPRASTLTSSPSWTAGNSLPISISRASSSFTHDITIKVNGVTIKSLTGIGTSTTVTFNSTEMENIFIELAKDTTNFDQVSTIIVTTKNGGSTIGTNTYQGTCSSPSATSLSASNFNIGASVPITITESNSNFTHTITATLGSYSTTIVTKTTSTSVTWDTAPIASNLYNQLPSSNSGTVTLTCTTYYGNTQVRNPVTKTITATVTNSNPTFGSNFTYRDTNSTTAAITGNDQYIIQNYSTVLVEIPTSAKATAVNGATMVQYVATLNGVERTAAYSSSSTVTFDFGVVNASSNLTLSIKAIDSRGNFTTSTKTVNILPYTPPVANSTATRQNSFENNTTLTLNGSFSPLSISGTNKNSILAMQYRYKESTSGTWGSWLNFTYNTNGSTFTATDIVLDLDNTKAWNIEVQVLDKISGVVVSKTVAVGQPIFFIDSAKKSLGVNKFPTGNNTVEVTGSVDVDGTAAEVVVHNPNNSQAYVRLGWINDVARIRYGGYNQGATNGFEIQGPSDATKFRVDNAGYAYATALKLSSTTDVSATSTGHGLTIGNDTTGDSIKIDTNEIASYTNGAPDVLNLNADGGDVHFHYNTSKKLTIKNGEIVNEARIAPSLLNGWVNYGGNYLPASYWKDKNGVVHLSGLIKNGTTAAGTTLFVLPAGYRPAGVEIHINHSPNYVSGQRQFDFVRIDVYHDGNVVLQTVASASWISLAGISFKAEN
jgi:hypothetical protein